MSFIQFDGGQMPKEKKAELVAKLTEAAQEVLGIPSQAFPVLIREIGGLLEVKSVLHVSNDGSLNDVKKIRGRKKSIRTLFEEYKTRAIKPEEQMIYKVDPFVNTKIFKI